MLYLESFTFPTNDMEIEFLWNIEIDSINYGSFYPFKVLSANSLTRLDFEPVTILYGGNGSGKTTALNIIAEKIRIKRDSLYNKSSFEPDYIKMCGVPALTDIPGGSRIITSDDVFDYMLNIRNINGGVDNKREELFEEYLKIKHAPEYQGFQMKSLEDYEQFKKINKAKKITQTKFVRNNLMNNIREYSNGESAYKYFTEKIGENSLYILDEPENSLSPDRQLELAGFIADSARFYKCQFIISTHSPFFLAMKSAKIYDLDANPAAVKRWTELKNMRVYHDFFKSHNHEFL